jgi:hypothetical protein
MPQNNSGAEPTSDTDLARFIREGAQDGLWGDQITPNIMAWG